MKIRKIFILLCLVFVSSTVSCISESVAEETKFENNYLLNKNNANALTASNDRKSEQSQSQTTSGYDSIVIAEYTESKVIRKKNYFDEVKRTNDLSAAIGGRVYTFKVQKVICRRELTKPNNLNSNSLTKFSFFDVDGSGFYQLYEKKKKYLVFLSALPEQSKLKENFELEPQTTYYSPYPILDAGKNERRVEEISSELNDNHLTRLKSLCVK